MFWEFLLALFTMVAPSSGAFAPATIASPDAVITNPVVDSVQVSAFTTGRSAFQVRFGDQDVAYRVMAAFVLPNETLPLAIAAPDPRSTNASYEVQPAAGEARTATATSWTWKAPARPGLVPIRIANRATGETLTINVFVMTPYTAMRRGRVNGYLIGRYPLTRPGHEAEYARPRGFVEVTDADRDVQVSPHFRLSQFLCKQAGGDPKYLVMRPELLDKLEALLAEVNQHGIEAGSFSIMSAYRTPSYNAAIGNVTVFSRHEYGDAADIFVDEDHDGVMDDLNHDGRHTLADAHVLQSIVDESRDQPEFAGLVGGLGTYAPTSEHGPFVHVDVRGFEVRWGV